MPEMKLDDRIAAALEHDKKYTVGAKCFLDTLFSGMIPCTVIAVQKPCHGFLHGRDGEIRIRIDETVKAYKKGEEIDKRACDVVPRKHRFLRGFHYRVNTAYTFLPEGHELLK